MDLSEFDGLTKAQDDGIEISIFHPKTGEEMDLKIKVAGPESAKQKRIRSIIMNDRLLKNRNRRVTVTELEADALRISSASIISWENVVINGETVELTPENAEMVLKNYPFIRDQVDAAINDRALFIKS
jgi:hypothetical protein